MKHERELILYKVMYQKKESKYKKKMYFKASDPIIKVDWNASTILIQYLLNINHWSQIVVATKF